MVTTTDRRERYSRALDFAGEQLRRLIEAHPDSFPIYTVGGKWLHGGEAWTNWCEGFLGGQLWLLYDHTGDPYWRGKAEHYSRLIEHRVTDRTVHDLGFLFWSTWKRWYDLTREEAINAVVIDAGRTLALRFKERGEYLRSFVADESLFIDIMMNVGIIFYAAQQTGMRICLRIATRHCLTTRRTLVRGDGSTAHEGIFDTATGEFLRQSTHQGWRGDSAWARGQAWALYGFGTVYRSPKMSASSTPPRRVRTFTSSAPPPVACLRTTGMSRIPRCPTKARPRQLQPAACWIWPGLPAIRPAPRVTATMPATSWIR